MEKNTLFRVKSIQKFNLIELSCFNQSDTAFNLSSSSENCSDILFNKIDVLKTNKSVFDNVVVNSINQAKLIMMIFNEIWCQKHPQFQLSLG